MLPQTMRTALGTHTPDRSPHGEDGDLLPWENIGALAQRLVIAPLAELMAGEGQTPLPPAGGSPCVSGGPSTISAALSRDSPVLSDPEHPPK